MSDSYNETPNSNEQHDGSTGTDEKKKLTDVQLRLVQAVSGILCAAALFLSMFIPAALVKNNTIDSSSYLNYLFVVVFLVIMIGRRRIENKYRLRLGLFSLFLIDGILVGLIYYVITMLYDPSNTGAYELADTYKVLIIVGMLLVLLILGVLIPLLRYRKRLANGTVPPIRIPEKPASDEPAAPAPADDNRPMTLEEKIAAMTRELDSQPDNNTEQKDADDNNSEDTDNK